MAESFSSNSLLGLKNEYGKMLQLRSIYPIPGDGCWTDLETINFNSVMLSGCTQYFVVWRTKFCWPPPAALSPLAGFPLVRTRS